MEKLVKQFGIPIQSKTKDKAAKKAARGGISISDFVRGAVESELKATNPPIHRPPVGGADERLSVNFTKTDRVEIRAKAAVRDVSMAEFIRSAVDRELKK